MKKQLHLIGNAHIDPVWLWTWQEGFQEVLATFRSALDRMKEYPGFVFTASSAVFYTWVEQVDPSMLVEIRQRVAEGRWRLVGGWWIEPDCNIPGGESFVRQELYGQRTFQSLLGKKARVGFNPDSFGHSATLPQILRGAGMEAYVFMRPGPNEKDLPGPVFWWEGPDGSRVLALRVPFTYATWKEDLESHVRDCAAELENSKLPGLLCFYGVGDHGGGPTRQNLANLNHLSNDPGLPQLVFSSPEQYADMLADDPGKVLDHLPTVRDELQHHARGCYSAHSGIKHWNRMAEERLLAAEKLGIVAHLMTGAAYPQVELERAWKQVLFHQFHDSLAGTSLPAAYEDARNAYGEALSVADRAINLAVQSIGWRINIPVLDKGGMVAAFNPLAWPVTAELQVESHFEGQNRVAIGPDGSTIPVQEIKPEVEAWQRRMCFMARLPALGYAVYRMVETDPAGGVDQEAWKPSQPGILENDLLRLEFNPTTGGLCHLLDKTSGVDLLAGDAAMPVVIADDSDTWSHDLQRYDGQQERPALVCMGWITYGPVKTTLRVEHSYGRSAIRQEFTLFTGQSRVDVAVSVDWHEHFKALKLRFPVALEEPHARFGIPFGSLERALTGEEEPAQGWVSISGLAGPDNLAYGFSLVNDSKFSYDVCPLPGGARSGGADLGLMVLRSPVFAQHDPQRPKPGQEYQFMDQGSQEFHYCLLPHPGDWASMGIPRQAAAFGQPPVIIPLSPHSGERLPLQAQNIIVTPQSIVVSAMKLAEDGNGLILRAYEAHGEQTRAQIDLPVLRRSISVGFGPAEIKTFRIPWNSGDAITETDLIESA